MPKNLKIRRNPSDAYKNRIAKIKDKLPKNWRETLFDKCPEYDNVKGSNLVNNVYMLRTADITITEIMEQISTNYIKEITKENQEIL